MTTNENSINKVNNIDDKKLEYAWNWFEYHAGQRLTAFNYFLILIGVVVAGYLKCVELAGKSQPYMEQAEMAAIWWSLAFAIGLFGMIISMAFWFLDIRNEELINCGRDALELLESSMKLTIRQDDKERNHLAKSLDFFSRLIPLSFMGKLASHHFWLRSIILFSAMSFFIASCFTAWIAFCSIDSTFFALENPQNLTSIGVVCGNVT
jgi:hypothetical protein